MRFECSCGAKVQGTQMEMFKDTEAAQRFTGRQKLYVIQQRLLSGIVAERQAQDKKWGDQRGLPRERWATILTEEVGEIARAILENDTPGLKTELIQLAAVSVAFAEALEDVNGVV